MGEARLYAGASGFAYDSWKPDFYPADLPAKKYPEHYAARVNSVEVNYTFRRNPSESTVRAWIDATPAGFRFAVKAHMRITHGHKPDEVAGSAEYFGRCLRPLLDAGRMGPVLVQLPHWRKASQRTLAHLLDSLSPDYRYAFEFRDASWMTEETYAPLRERNAALCLAESDEFVVPHVVTANFVYLRLRRADYTAADLEQVRGRVRELLGEGKTVYLYFKHEETAEGVLNAERVLAALGDGSS